MSEKIKIGIIGCGFVGGALKTWIEENNSENCELFISDPPKGYNDDLSKVDVAFVQIHVPTEEDGTQDLTLMKELIRKLPDVPVFVRTTILPGTSDLLSKETGHQVCFMPEFLTERTYIEDFRRQPMVFTGAPELLHRIFRNKFYVEMTPLEAEITKYGHNVFGAYKVIYFNALYSEGVQGIFRTCADSLDTPELLTPDGDWHDYDSPYAILEDGTMLTTYCSMDFPSEIVAINADGPEQWSGVNDAILGQLLPHKTEKKWVDTVDGQKMLTWVLYPPQFDSTKVYPAIEILLGGPQGTLSQGWSYRWNYLLMAHQGYIVVLPNRRGTTAFGQAWCEEISGDYPGLNMQDYLSAARMIKAEPYVGKLAAAGASYGGYSVYYMAGIHEDTFDCFIAHAGIFDETYMYYETEEMWFPNWDNGGLTEYAYESGKTGPAGDGITFGGMQQAGSPWSSAEKARRHYANSPAANVTKWHTPILCIHGMNDYRIPYDQGMAAFNAAQMMGVPSKLVVFPEENHWILKPQNALFWHKTYFDWLGRWCTDRWIKVPSDGSVQSTM